MKLFKKYILLLFLIPVVLYSENPDSIRTVNAKFMVDSIKISGNEITEDHIILRELNFQPGDSVSLKQLHFNRERVFSLGLFNRVEINRDSILPGNILIDVYESWYIYPIPFWYVMEGDIKKSTYGLNFTLKNFRGRNQTLRAAVGLGYDSYFSLSFDNPSLIFENGIGLSFSSSFYQTKNKNLQAEKLAGKEFEYKIFGIYTGMYVRFNQFNLAGFNLGFTYRESEIAPLRGITASQEKIDRFPSASVYYYYDSRDLKLFSDYGFYSALLLAHKGFGVQGISYNVFEADFRQYLSLSESFTAKCRVNGRHTFGNLIPFYDYSFLGYQDKIRGHYSDYLEGHNSILTSLELSYPVVREWNVSLKLPLIPRSLTSARIGVFITGFVDAGTTFDNNERISISKFNSGYGFGLTFLVLPYNAFRIEYAINEFGKGEFVFASGFSF